MRRLLLLVGLALTGCPTEEEGPDLPPLVLDDDDTVDDDDSSSRDWIPCGAPDAGAAYFSPHATELATIVPLNDARALAWAMEAASYPFMGQLSGGVELTLFALSDDDCPVRSTASSTLEPDARCLETSRNTLATSNWSGDGCVAICEFQFSGVADFGLRRLECSTEGGLLREVETTVVGDGLQVGALVRHLGGVNRFGLMGRMQHLHRETTAADGDVTVREEWTLDGDFTSSPGSPKGFLSGLWRQGSGLGAAAGFSEAVYVAGAPTQVRAEAAGRVTTGAVMAPYEAEFDVAWDATVCALEPTRGSITAHRWDRARPDGARESETTITFDGAASCDGCGTVYSSGVAVAEFCGAPAPSPPPLD